MEYIYQYDVCALCLTAILGIVYLMRRSFPLRSNRIFFAMTIVGFLSSLFDLLSAFAIPNAEIVPLWANYLISILYLIFFNGSALLYTYYIMVITNDETAKRSDRVLLLVCLTIEVTLVASTPITRYIFYFDDELNYKHGDLFIMLYLISISMMIVALVKFIRFRSRLSVSLSFSIIFFNITVILSVIFQIIFPERLITNLVDAFFLMLVFISLQNPNDYIDVSTELYNRAALERSLSNAVKNEQEITIAAFTLDGYQYIKRMMGKNVCNNMVWDISKQLVSVFGKRFLYRTGECSFVVQLDKNDKPDTIVNQIQQNFTKRYVIQQVEVMISPLVCVIRYPDFAKSSEEVIVSIKYLLEEMRNSDTKVIYASEDNLSKMYRESEIIHVIKRAIRNDEFQVWYQPIYNVKTGKFSSAEALVRLNDDKLGFISPDEFIPIAEKNGLIVAVGELVFRHVCSFLRTSNALELGVEYIEVNLSAVQCMQDNLSEIMLGIMKEYNITPDMINFEITETAGAINEEVLRRNMRLLIEAGSSFSMDDYGTGFSTANYLISLPLDIVKIDKSILWPAMQDKRAYAILYHTVKMLKSLNKHIVVEGVETEKMAATLIEMECDYFQGYLYSKPITAERYIEFLEKNNT
ncbi:MAG: EAL domain-containing protein [Oscillospiraceae bacterium]